MNIPIAERMNAFSESIFSELTQIKKSKIAEGKEIIDLSIGNPDLTPPPFVVKTIVETAANPNFYGYSLSGTKEFNQGVCSYYKRNFSVDVDPHNEVHLLMGSQDGLVHLPMALCNPGDYILVPDPGYTAYTIAIALAGAKTYPMPLQKENNFIPDFQSIPKEIRKKAKLMILNFPGNPVPAMATKEFFEKAVEFAKENNIYILHDFAYSELYYEEKPISFLSINGAKDVGIEMNSLSKSFNMAGCRVGFACGNKSLIKMLANLKSNLDYGVFLPIQVAAAKALTDNSDFLENNRKIYKRRRDLFVNGLRSIGWNVHSPKASMFIWAEIPKGFNSKDFVIEILNRANVVLVPGNAFGACGEGFVRIALVQDEQLLIKAVQKIEESGIFSKRHYVL